MRIFNSIFSVFFVMLMAAGVARADIASTTYVDNNKLSAGDGISIGTGNKINVNVGGIAKNPDSGKMEVMEAAWAERAGEADKAIWAAEADKAELAVSDSNGNEIIKTYATKKELDDVVEKVAGNQEMMVTHPINEGVGDSAHPVYVDANGVVQKIETVAEATYAGWAAGADSASNAAEADHAGAADVADTATNAKKIPFGSENATTYVSIWVE